MATLKRWNGHTHRWEYIGEVASSAATVTYSNPLYPTVEAALNKLLYVNPAISSFSLSTTPPGGTLEIGTTVTQVNLSWAFNKTMTAVSLSGGTITPSDTSYVFGGLSLTSDTSYALTCSDGVNSDQETRSVQFRHKRYYGISAEVTLDDNGIKSLSSELSSSRGQSRQFVCTGDFIYFAWPESFGTPSFTVNGLPNTAWTLVRNNSFVNSMGYSSEFRLYRSDNILTGTFDVVVN